MTQTIHGLFATDAGADAAISELHASGFAHGDISLIANQVPTPNDANHVKVRDAAVDVAPDDELPGVQTAMGVGGASGAAVGLLAGVGMLAIPGLGGVVALGWLASLVTGAAAGAATGGLIGILTETGVSGEHAEFYNEGIKHGAALVTVRAPDAEAARADAILDRHGRILPPGGTSAYAATA